MSEHHATTTWRRQTASFAYDDYNRAHEVRFGGGQIVPWSGAKEFKGDAERPNPEEAFVAALSTCHMLTFLAIASRKRFTAVFSPWSKSTKVSAGHRAVRNSSRVMSFPGRSNNIFRI